MAAETESISQLTQVVISVGVNTLIVSVIAYFIKREVKRYDSSFTRIEEIEKELVRNGNLSDRIDVIEDIKKDFQSLEKQFSLIDRQLDQYVEISPRINQIMVDFQVMKKDIEMTTTMIKPLYDMRDDVVILRRESSELWKAMDKIKSRLSVIEEKMGRP